MTALRSFASPLAHSIYELVNVAETSDQLDQLARRLWHAYGKGLIGDDDAVIVQSLIDRRRPLGRNTAPGQAKPISSLSSRLGSRFTPRQRPRSPDRKASRCRRRRLGGSSALPADLRYHYTEGQRAVLCIMAGEVKHHGICDLPIDKIAALAGVCRTTVQTTLHEARRVGHIRITERPQARRKNLPNVIEVISREWWAWLERGPSPHRPIGSNLLKMVSPTKNTDPKKESVQRVKKPQEAAQGVPRTTFEPPDRFAGAKQAQGRDAPKRMHRSSTYQESAPCKWVKAWQKNRKFESPGESRKARSVDL